MIHDSHQLSVASPPYYHQRRKGEEKQPSLYDYKLSKFREFIVVLYSIFKKKKKEQNSRRRRKGRFAEIN